MDNLVELRGIRRWFGREEVLRGVDLDLPRGSVTAILGRNGSGKSTLMRIAAGLLGRDGGEARVLGCDPERLGAAELSRISYVNDVTTAVPHHTVAHELGLHRRLRGATWVTERVDELLQRFEVPQDKRISELSKGQQTRLRIVLALASDPELLLLDEPALGLDLFARHDLMEVVIETVERDGRGVLIASHLLDDVERIADRVAFMRHGEIQTLGTVDELRERFRRVTFSLGSDERACALELEAPGLLGVRRVVKGEGPRHDRVVVCEDFADGMLSELERKLGAKRLEVRRMSLREIYFEVLAGREEEVVA